MFRQDNPKIIEFVQVHLHVSQFILFNLRGQLALKSEDSYPKNGPAATLAV
jgi:hypothetical protein